MIFLHGPTIIRGLLQISYGFNRNFVIATFNNFSEFMAGKLLVFPRPHFPNYFCETISSFVQKSCIWRCACARPMSPRPTVTKYGTLMNENEISFLSRPKKTLLYIGATSKNKSTFHKFQSDDVNHPNTLPTLPRANRQSPLYVS